ncbi:YhgE/Pip family protein [Lysinibacter sp. HNR]|uniref:YhgE/Pip family protein n=1 Tax=Lysinibacter sp. HNR TaxID=3031408 RepID=UPI002434A80A|nr:YhgE/Pip family protein [Lysinibacter sp. HNR]WGD37469.1 YhgE/Pip family protein [Lysinibacter sp. HNR]
MSRLSLDRAHASKKLSPWSLLGLVLVPLLLGATLVWGLWNPADRLNQMTGAVVNNDEPVTRGDQLTPLGRLLAGELVDGDADQNFRWVITDTKDAEEGLANGSYATVVTIPKNFSAAATSFSGDAASAEQATLDIATSPQSKLVDTALAQTVTATAGRVLGQQLTETYLDNLYVGFNTLGDNLSEAGAGATTLADGASQAADGAAQLASGGADLGSGLGTLTSGAQQLSGGVSSLATGARSLSGGAAQLQAGAGSLSSGLNEFAAGLDQTTAQLAPLPDAMNTLSGITANAAGPQTQALHTELSTLANQIAALRDTCTTDCDALNAALNATLNQMGVVSGAATQLLTSVGYTNGYVNGQPGQPGLAAQMAPLTSGLGQAAAAAHQLADGAAQLTQGAAGLTAGAGSLATGAGQAAAGANGLVAGAASAQSGATQLAEGATDLTAGVSSLSEGITSLGTGLTQATDSLPTTTESERANLTSVVATPISTGGSSANFFDATGVPFFATLALWVGALVSFLLLRATPRRAMTAAQSVFALTSRGLLPGIVIGALQGVLVAGIMQFALALSLGEWFAFAALSAVAGVAFSTVNQGLVAVFGGFGRFISMLITVLALAAGIVSTVPAVYDQILSVLPLLTAIDGMRAISEGTGSLGGAFAGLIGWFIVGCLLTLFAVTRKRSLGVSAIPKPRTLTA